MQLQILNFRFQVNKLAKEGRLRCPYPKNHFLKSYRIEYFAAGPGEDAFGVWPPRPEVPAGRPIRKASRIIDDPVLR